MKGATAPPHWQHLPLPGAEVRLCADFLESACADRLLAVLLHELPWQQHHVRLFGRRLPAPRLSCWIGDPQAAYAYSGTRYDPFAWTPALLELRDALARVADAPFNSVLANLYRDGNDAMGWHADDERELGPRPLIASLSLGQPRRFRFREHGQPGASLGVDLPHGSLLLMAGDTQQRYRHALPRTARPVGPRINLTFRYIQPA